MGRYSTALVFGINPIGPPRDPGPQNDKKENVVRLHEFACPRHGINTLPTQSMMNAAADRRMYGILSTKGIMGEITVFGQLLLCVTIMILVMVIGCVAIHDLEYNQKAELGIRAHDDGTVLDCIDLDIYSIDSACSCIDIQLPQNDKKENIVRLHEIAFSRHGNNILPSQRMMNAAADRRMYGILSTKGLNEFVFSRDGIG